MTLILILVLANRRSLLGLGGQRALGPLAGRDLASSRSPSSPRSTWCLTVLGWFGLGVSGARRAIGCDLAPFAPDQGVRGGYAAMVGRVGTAFA